MAEGSGSTTVIVQPPPGGVGVTVGPSKGVVTTPTTQPIRVTAPVGERGPKGDPGPGIPPGGTVGQILVKTGPGDYEVGWVDP